ncbi:asparagine synthase [Cooperia oncophora]
MFFLSEKIRQMGIKVVLSGEGADEIFGGYLYFHNAPNDDEFQKETIDRVLHLYTADCLRADKSTMAHSVEVRVPFLDKAFLEATMLTAAKYKRPQALNGRNVEKRTFLMKSCGGKRNSSSDGVGYSWIDELMAFCARQVTDEEFSKAEELFPYNTPHSKEAFYMRKLFHEMFPSDNAAKTVRRWIPKWQLSQDPSGRASLVHDQSVHKRDKNA